MKQYIATLSILNLDRQGNAGKINKILSKHAHIISARLGVNVQRTCTSKCQTLINLFLSATKREIKELETDLKYLENIKLKISIF
jgi:hypothetical protein